MIRSFPILILVIAVAGCATPVGVKSAGEEEIHRQLTVSALTGDRPSACTAQLLARLSLDERFRKQPAAALRELHRGLGGPDQQDRLFALAELSYLHARRARDGRYFLAAAVYAYAFLFPEDPARWPQIYDPRLRLGMDLYNRSVTNALRRDGHIDVSPRLMKLPFGEARLTTGAATLDYGGFRLTDFVSVEDFTIHGLRNHYRRPGIGAALAAQAEAAGGGATAAGIAPHSKVPVTLLVRFERPIQALQGKSLTGRLELYDADAAANVAIDGRNVPLETDPSAALAYALDDSPLWDFEIAGFRRGDFSLFGRPAQGNLFFMQPYRPGRIPIVFVHGTASSPARWAQMLNELQCDPRIASRYQFWFFMYNSGNPISDSAMHLRENLQKAVRELDPQGRDAALRDMVVIGHSQGGLLAKLTVVDSGTRFWDDISRVPLEKARLSAEARDMARRGLFVTPLPFVRRVVFIATPHGGSYMADNFAGALARRFITLPGSLTKTTLELIKLNPAEAARTAIRIPTAIDNMSWGNKFLRTLHGLPPAPGVRTHSIVAVKGKGPAEAGGDGIVRYTSAHLAGVESELVVRTGHSCQSDPHTIEEVRRILYEHAGVR